MSTYAIQATLDQQLADLDAVNRTYSNQTPQQRASYLDAIAEALDADAADLVRIAASETHLSIGRLEAELKRTTNQLRLFATTVRDSSYSFPTIDGSTSPADPELRRTVRPIGPVGVFSAGNFPFAFSVAGGDTASALAAGCPVVVKIHSGHPKLSHRVLARAQEALEQAGAPTGVLRAVEGREAGSRLVAHPAIRAVAFTGSPAGGRALFDIAVSRPDPIPFYGELGSANPVFLLPSSVARNIDELVHGLIESFTLGAGQYCTKPSIIFYPGTLDLPGELRSRLADAERMTLLTEQNTVRYLESVAQIVHDPHVTVAVGDPTATRPIVLSTDIQAFLNDADGILQSECFGPLSLVVRYTDPEQLIAAARRFEGVLTATVHADGTTEPQLTRLVRELERVAGRIVFNGWPTGVKVGWATTHGGPFPATTFSGSTSVGVHAIDRFLRPVTYQNMPDDLLPRELQEDWLTSHTHRRNGSLRVQH